MTLPFSKFRFHSNNGFHYTEMLMRRLEVTFPSDGDDCAAWLYLPDTSRPAPVIVMAHGLGGTREMRLDAFAHRFCEAGFACLVFDYRHFGSSGGEPRQLLDVGKQLQDWRAAIAFARTRTDVDAERLIVWGSSFGGGHALTIAADNAHVSAVIAQCPFTDGLASVCALPLGSLIKVTARAIRDQFRAWLGGHPVTIPIAGKPGGVALMVAPDAEPGYMKLVPNDMSAVFRNYVAARFALQIIRYFPGRKTSRIACPVLFCVCDPDTVAPTRTTLRHAKRAPKGLVNIYPFGHFDIYVGYAFERAVSDQITFLQRFID
ncbi:alpha/beta hydrolase [Burkholderia ambifaria]|nr:alpha/beta hydrolase [Burkholderia ambifaria]UZU00590.1 alpha/beta fold hydrolase [Burkholderia ambifaria]UZU07142.1 alpha/beta fold hydrolase [Burkholderia ambifaria]WDS11029.1 alpha/beta fold hydrolase [Burkholderia ambifaria]WDS24164.1 alpha/beta fold hydrolase [Burkholderia ambifaria]